ncbi:putative F-box/kelch-repeat protein At1g15680 [Henckelia pumila]|uniref:putative F-box/kelch-repeat protein At1g15680 n=1 Tax=Henckelia pumila TaxID=405737 RepID=UPI003C6DD1A2
MDSHETSNLRSAELIDVGDIPEWMLWEVLMRLPLKVLFQSKVVSKQWCCMISDPSFARMLYADRIWRFPLWILVSSFANKAMIDHFSNKKLAVLDGCNSIGANCLDLIVLRHGQEVGVDGWDFIVVAISNGLLLYGPRVECPSRLLIYSYDICNPITGQRIILPPSQHCFEFVATGFVTQVQDNVLQSFRVVRVDVHHMDSGFVRFDVYFSEIRKWKYFQLHSLIYFYKWKNPVVFRQTLHWMITKHRLLAYDPYNNSVRFTRLPSDDPASYEESKIDVDDALFDEHGGHLRYAEVKLDDRGWTNVSIWVLDDYDSARWCLQHRVGLEEPSDSSVPLSFHPFDSNIVYIINGKLGLYSYDFKSRELIIVDGSTRCYRHQLPYALSYFNFVIPPWPLFIHPSLF